MTVWRCHLKSDAEGVDPAEFAIRRGIVGIGWRIPNAIPRTWEEYVTLGQDVYKGTNEHRKWWAAARAIHDRMQVNDLCYTRDRRGVYYLGRITSEWRYVADDEHLAADLVNIRDCEWHQIGVSDSVPGKVLASMRSRRTLQVVEGVDSFSQLLYNSLAKHRYYPPPKQPIRLFDLLSDEDLEDLAGIYLQARLGYVVVPSSVKRDSVGYEFVLLHGTSGKKAVIQVKSGNVSLNLDAYRDIPAEVYLLSASGKYYGQAGPNVHCLDPNEIHDFAVRNSHLLPERIRVWVTWWRDPQAAGAAARA